MNVNVHVGVRVTVSSCVSVSVNVCRGGLLIVRARRDLSNAVDRAQIHSDLSKSMWRAWGGPRPPHGEGCTGNGTTPLLCDVACAG